MQCPKCKGDMWDNRPKKRSGEFKPNAPDFACKDKSCGGKIWPSEERNDGPANPFNEPEWAKEQEKVERQATKAIKQGDSDADILLLLEQRMNLCLATSERVTAKNENTVSDPQALAVTFFIELNKIARV